VNCSQSERSIKLETPKITVFLENKFCNMSFKIKFLLSFLLVNLSTLFAQDIAIPYRNGDLWGICNESGKTLIEPKFDAIEFPNTHQNGNDYMISKLNGLHGLILDGNEILAPKYTNIYDDNGLFYTKSTDNGSQVDILLPSGKSIFDKPFAKIIYQTTVEKNKKLFHVLNTNLTESVFVMDLSNYKILQVLYENYHSISYIRTMRSDVRVRAEIVFMVKKSVKSNLIAESWGGTEIPLKKASSDFRYLKEEEYLQFFSGRYDSNYKSKSGSYSGRDDNHVVEAVSGEGDYGSDIAIEAPGEAEKPQVSDISGNKQINLNYNLVVKDNKLFLESVENRDYKTKRVTPITIEVPTSEIKLPYSSFTIKKENGTDTFSNYIRYQKNGKTIVILPNDLKNKLEFDFLDERNFAVKENNNIKENVFLVGKKDKNNQIKYGLYSNVRKQIVDFMYDEFQYIQFYANDGKMLFKIKKDNKFGVIQAEGTVLLPANFSDLKEVNNSYRSGSKVFQIQNNSKYGLVYLTSTEIKIVAPVFDYPIKGVIAKYPEYKNTNLHKSSNNIKTIPLIELKDNSGEFMGYAAFDGTQFFKD
jgi:hypothetical protein